MAISIRQQILLGDDIAQSIVVGDEFLNELVQTALEDIVHLAVFKPVSDTAGMSLCGSLAAVSDTNLIEILYKIAITARERTRQRIVQDQQVGDQPGLQGFAIDPMIGRERRDRTQDRCPLVEVQPASILRSVSALTRSE